MRQNKNKSQIQTSSQASNRFILQVPNQNYQQDFIFIINGEKFQTNKIIAYLSIVILKHHQYDPTIGKYSISTNHKGDFQLILSLSSFNTKNINETEIQFISEIIENLGIEKINVNHPILKINLDDVFDSISLHEKSSFFYSKQLLFEIDFLSEHFYELDESHKKKLLELNKETIAKIISNKKLSLKTEDELLKFVNVLYTKNKEFSQFFEYVHFTYVSNEVMNEFISIFDIDYLTHGAWNQLAERLMEAKEKEMEGNIRYKKLNVKKKENCESKKTIEIPKLSNSLKGIFSYLNEHSNIKDEVEVKPSSYDHGSADLLLDIESQGNYYCTQNVPNSLICFEFKKYGLIPSNYTIKSVDGGPYLKSWVVEGSPDNNEWIKIDERSNCSHLNGAKKICTFPISQQNDKIFKSIRIRQTDLSWDNNHYVDINSIEFYGKLVID